MEYGFATGVSRANFDDDPITMVRVVKHLLRYNYEQTQKKLEFDPDIRPRFFRGEDYEDYDDDGNVVPMVKFMWYVCDDPEVAEWYEENIGKWTVLDEEAKAW